MKTLNIRLRSLAVFRSLLRDPVIAALAQYLDTPAGETAEAVSRYAEFVSQLYATGSDDLTAYVKTIVGNDENPYIRLVGRGVTPSAQMEKCVERELSILQTVAELTPEALCRDLNWQESLPGFTPGCIDLAEYYRERCRRVGEFGYGIYARYRMFYIDAAGKIVPVENPDATRLSELIDYKREQQIILDNTTALLQGRPAANILLTGDAGTGKSSTVKAVVNELWMQGLRILEVRKEQLHQIPGVLDALSDNPLKFIMFIDDLSFRKDDDNFSALKAILEGSVSAKSANVVIYATSNRRHLVKETFSDREGDDIHHNDTVQEIISLSERFGIQITFQKPNKKTYLEIVHHLAQQRGISYDPVRLEMEAERFALNRGGRSARAATQFVDSLMAKA